MSHILKYNRNDVKTLAKDTMEIYMSTGQFRHQQFEEKNNIKRTPKGPLHDGFIKSPKQRLGDLLFLLRFLLL
jgi:hypothetical protein